jgi:hypothetical protein
MKERKPFLLRIDPGLWSELEAWAQAELRSVNGQIEYLLRDAVQRRRGGRREGGSGPVPPSRPASGPAAGSAPRPTR